MKVIIVGGGWSGCAASISAPKQGAEVHLLERTDMLLGTGLVGGIMRNNGRFTATEEMIAMGGGELFQLIDQNSLHRNIEFPGHHHASLYNVATMEPLVKGFLLEKGIDIHLSTRIEDVEMEGARIKAVLGKQRRGEDSFRRRCLYRCDRHGRTSCQLHEIWKRLCDVHPSMSLLRWTNQPHGKSRSARKWSEGKGIRSEP